MNTGELRVLSYNIRYDSPADGVHTWANRRKRVVDQLRFHRPDIIGVQEALLGQIEDLAEGMAEYEWVGEGREGELRGEFTPLLFRKERLRVLRSWTRWLSQEPSRPGSIGWDADTPRTVTSAEVEERRTGEHFFAHNTHFDNLGKEAVRKSVDLLRAWVTRDGSSRAVRTLVTGDFNFDPGSVPHRELAESLLDARDTAKEMIYGPETTYVGPGFLASHTPGPRFDYIFVSPDIAVLRYATLSDSWDGTHPSDHFPVMAEVLLEGARN